VATCRADVAAVAVVRPWAWRPCPSATGMPRHWAGAFFMRAVCRFGGRWPIAGVLPRFDCACEKTSGSDAGLSC